MNIKRYLILFCSGLVLSGLAFPVTSTAMDGLDACLERMISKHGAYDEGHPDFQACYKEWVGTTSHPVKSFAITYTSFGSFPCYTQRTVTISDADTSRSVIQYKEKMPECLPSSGETRVEQDIAITWLTIEQIRLLLNAQQLQSYQDEYVESVIDAAGSEWTFTLNDEPPKRIRINVKSFSVLPKNLQVLLYRLGQVIHPRAR